MATKNPGELLNTVREHPLITTGMEMDDELLKSYFKALESGHEYAKHIQLMVVGMWSAGKTTLARKLLNNHDAIESTVGIDILIDACEIDENGKWVITEFQDEEKGYLLRLQELFESDKTAQKDRKSAPTEIIYDGNEQKTHQAQDVDMELKENPTDEIKSRRTENLIDIFKNELKQEAEEKKLRGRTPYYNVIEQSKRNALQWNVAIKRPTISVWDFAGQSVYYLTHHFFLNPRAIYLLVLDLSKELNEELNEETVGSVTTNLYLGNTTKKHFTQLDAFQFWMRSIYIHTQQKQSLISTDSSHYSPTIILIGTHKDKVNTEDPDTYAKEYFKTALDSVECISGLKDLICETKFFFGKDDSLDKLDALRSKIYQVAKDRPFWDEKIPGKFIPLERIVAKKKSDNCQIMSFQELEEVSADSYYPLKKAEIQVFLKFQHASGNILHYDKVNPDMIILTPQWLIDAFKLFVTHTWSRDSEDFKDFNEYAKLSGRLVDILLRSKGNWLDYKVEILKYMEYSDILAKPVMSKGKPKEDAAHATTSQLKVKEELAMYRWPITITTGETTESEDFYFMPCMLPPRPHADEIKNQLKLVEGESSPVLCMYIGGVFLPPSIFHRILATCIKKMPVLIRKKRYVLYNGLGAFEIDKTTILTIWSLDNMIYLKVTYCHSESKNRYVKKKMLNADLTEVRQYVDSLVRELFNIGGHHLSDTFNIAYYIACPDCPEMFPYDRTIDDNTYPIDPLGDLFEVEEALQTRNLVCNSNLHRVTQTRCLSQWFDTRIALTEIDPYLSERLLKKPDSLFLADMADEIEPDRIDELAERLHIAYTQQCKIKFDHGKPILRYIFHILYMWSKRKPNYVQLFAVAPQLGCSKKDFTRMLDGTDSDRVKADIESIREQISLEKLNTIVLNDDNCMQIAASIGEEYWLLGIRLGLEEMFIQREHATNFDDTNKIIKYNILLAWLKESDPFKRNEELIRAMVKCECSMDVLLEIFKADIVDEIDPDQSQKPDSIFLAEMSDKVGPDPSKKPDSLFLADMADQIEPDLLEHLSKEPDSLVLADMAAEINADRIYALAERLDISYNENCRIKIDYGKPVLCYIFHILHAWSRGKRDYVPLFKVATELGCSKQDFIRMLDGTDSDRVKEDIERLRKEIGQEKLDTIVLNEGHCMQITESIGAEYWLLGIRLGMKESFLQRKFMSNDDDIENIIKIMLMKWVKQSKLSNTERNEKLIRAMAKCGCNMRVLRNIFK